MNIALFTLYHENYWPLAELVLPNWSEYCDRHDYGLMAHRGPYGHFEGFGFQKTELVHDELFVKYNTWEAALVLDLDILITNFTVKVEDFMDESHDIFVTTGFNGLCLGSYIIKKTQGGREIMEFMLANEHGYNNEQDTLKYHLDDPVLKDRIKLFPYHAFGSFMLSLYPEHGTPTRERGNWQPGDFLLHLPGFKIDKRLEVFQSPEVRNAIVR
jgi:hypothetical protein